MMTTACSCQLLRSWTGVIEISLQLFLQILGERESQDKWFSTEFPTPPFWTVINSWSILKRLNDLLGSEMTEADWRALEKHSSWLALAPEVVQDLAKMSYIAFLWAQYLSVINSQIIFLLHINS